MGFCVTLALVPVMTRLARRFDIVDRPKHRKIHTAPVPLLGGVAILCGCLVGTALFLGFFPALRRVELSKTIAVAGAALLAGFVGLVDDRIEVRPRRKLLAQLLIVLAFALWGHQFKALGFPGFTPLGLSFLSLPVTVLWMLTIVNAMNFIDGVDALAGSVALVIFVVIGLMAANLNDVVAMALAAPAIGALAAFLTANWPPAKIYMGDAGSLGLGTLIAALLVSLGQNCVCGLIARGPEPYLYQILSVTIVAAYPVLEIALTVSRRLLRGKPLGSADQGHIHHRLIQRGWRAPHICLAAGFFSLLAGGATVFHLIGYRGLAAFFLTATGLACGIGLHFCGLLDAFRLSAIKGARPHFLLANHFIAMQKIKLDMADSLAELDALLEQTGFDLGVRRLSLSVVGRSAQPGRVFTCDRPPRNGANPLPPAAGTAPLNGFTDRDELAAIGTKAEWTFEPKEFEEDIDVEYRVLMSDFMHLALVRAEELYRLGKEYPSAQASYGEAPTGSVLPRRRSQRWPKPQ